MTCDEKKSLLPELCQKSLETDPTPKKSYVAWMLVDDKNKQVWMEGQQQQELQPFHDLTMTSPQEKKTLF